VVEFGQAMPHCMFPRQTFRTYVDRLGTSVSISIRDMTTGRQLQVQSFITWSHDMSSLHWPTMVLYSLVPSIYHPWRIRRPDTDDHVV
jgi:hypothetical protein